MSNTLTASSELVTLDAGNCCEDCPLDNLFPPTESNCPYFVNTGGFPDCTKREQQIQETSVYIGPICIPEVTVTIRNTRNANLV